VIDPRPRAGPQLISYPDSMGGGLGSLAELLEGSLAGCFGGVHVLPPYPSSGDRGFAPLDHGRIDPRFGSWADIERIGATHDVCLDLVVNHVSRRSSAFAAYERDGDASETADLFLPLRKVWPGGEPDPDDLAIVFRRRPRPWSEYRIGPTREAVRLWTTFGADDPSEQVDIDAGSPVARRMLADQLAVLAGHGVRMVRLDAIGYVIKRAGTSCFMVQPDLDRFLGWLRSVAGPLGLELLTEVHGDVPTQRNLARDGMLAYDFAFPGLVLDAVLTATADPLLAHLRAAPSGTVTTLDSHDGIPIQPDLHGALPLSAARHLVDATLAAGGNVSRVFARDGLPDPAFDAHQANCAWFAAVGRDDASHLLTRAIQLFAPGIPQVYYVGLLAGDNDPAAARATGDGRAVNRHDYGREELATALGRSVVRRTLELLRLRSSHPAFAGRVELAGGGHRLELTWREGSQRCSLRADLAQRTFEIDAT
jgi:sucrose 6(F)-phosphate phosphorylase